MSRLYLSNPCAFSYLLPLHTMLRAQSAPGFPCALSSEECAATNFQELGRNAPRGCGTVFDEHSRATSQVVIARP